MSVADDIPTSFIMDTNKGGIPVTICSCGLLMYKPMATKHFQTCPAYLADKDQR